jgi:hypothetical protein
VVEGARLESVYRSKAYRGFESRPLRNPTGNAADAVRGFPFKTKKPSSLVLFGLERKTPKAALLVGLNPPSRDHVSNPATVYSLQSSSVENEITISIQFAIHFLQLGLAGNRHLILAR